MGNGYEASAVSMRDVWEALVACRTDHGIPVRVVLFERMEATVPGVVCVVAQPCAGAAPVADVALVSRQAWPTNRFKSLTAVIHWTVWDVYQRLDGARELAARQAELSEP